MDIYRDGTRIKQEHADSMFSNIVRGYAESYNIADYGRGVKMRWFYNNKQFVESVLSLENIERHEPVYIKYDTLIVKLN